jgi:outer membrane protein assembly factor BamB
MDRKRSVRTRERFLLKAGCLLGALLLTGVVMVGCGGTETSSVASSSTVQSAQSAPLSSLSAPGPWDWPTYGHDAQHTFHGRTTLTESKVRDLRQAWFFRTGDAVTATPTVVDGTVYVGSWDDYFYALNLETGKLRWKTEVKPQNGVVPYPSEKHRDLTSDGGLITSSAWFEPALGTRPPLVIFGGGYTLYALNASTGQVYWEHDYSGRPGPLDPDTDNTRIFSSPVVYDGIVLFGVDVDGQAASGGFLVGADLDTGNPVWEYQTDVDASGQALDNGCGSIWSSGTVLPALGLVVYGTADCHFQNSKPLAAAALALHVSNGQLAWIYKPPLPDLTCDWDFGATPNAGVDAQGDANFLGLGGKDGTYYSLDPSTGNPRWATNVVFGGFSGGFIATTAYDGKRVYGATAIGDFGRFESNGSQHCDPSNPRDTSAQEPSGHAFDAATGAVLWHNDDTASFAPTTVAGGMTFNGLALVASAIQIRDARTGDLLVQVELPLPNWSGIATVGNALVFGLGTTYSPKPAGVEVLTPNGTAPVVPRGS